MNSRIKKKKFYNNVFTKIYGCNSDIIVMEYNMYSVPFDRLYRMYQSICKQVSGKTIIALPDIISLKDSNKEQLVQIRDYIDKIIGEQ